MKLYVHDRMPTPQNIRPPRCPIAQAIKEAFFPTEPFTVDCDYLHFEWAIKKIRLIPDLCVPIHDGQNKRDRRIARRCLPGLRNLLGTKQAQQHLNKRSPTLTQENK